jgi:hypothetical protein
MADTNEKFNKILYINGGVDFSPLIYFTQCKYFVYTDSMPRNDDDVFENKESKFRPQFTKKLVSVLWDKGFMLNSVDIVDPNYGWKISTWKQRFKHFFSRFLLGSPNLFSICPTRYVFFNSETQVMLVYFVSTDTRYNMGPLLKSEIRLVDGLILHESCKHNIFVSLHSNKKQIMKFPESSIVRVNMYDINSVLKKSEEKSVKKYVPQFFCVSSKVNTL